MDSTKLNSTEFTVPDGVDATTWLLLKSWRTIGTSLIEKVKKVFNFKTGNVILIWLLYRAVSSSRFQSLKFKPFRSFRNILSMVLCSSYLHFSALAIEVMKETRHERFFHEWKLRKLNRSDCWIKTFDSKVREIIRKLENFSKLTSVVFA